VKYLSKRVVKCLLLSLLAVIVAFVIGFVVIVGPWPVYVDSHYAGSPYFNQTLRRIDEHLAQTELTDNPGRLEAGWAEHDMTPPVGTPLAGFAGRPNAKRCTAIHDPVFARAIVLSDGHDTVALVGSDLLMTTWNIARKVWAEVAAQTPLTSDTIFFTTSHSHSSPGGFAPGLLPEYSYGKYAPVVEQQIASAMVGAIVDAYRAMKPGQIAHACTEAPELITNRTGMPGKDASLRFLVIENDSGQRCYAVRYSAHPTVLPEESLELSAEFPGALCRRIKERTGAMAVFLGGAVGAMKPASPAGTNPMERMQRMGDALADRVLVCPDKLTYATNVDIAALGAPVDMPPMQVRLFSPHWRMSPYLAYVVGLPPQGWIQAVRVGDIVFLGLPYDTGGEIAQEWATDAAKKGVDLWVSSHCIAYCGYLTPDSYYLNKTNDYEQEYEWRTMNWFGPNQEAMYRDIKDHILNVYARKLN